MMPTQLAGPMLVLAVLALSNRPLHVNSQTPPPPPSGCYAEGTYGAAAKGTISPTLFYVSIMPAPAEVRSSGRARQLDRSLVGQGSGTIKMTVRCFSKEKPCPFTSGTCEEAPATYTRPGSVSSPLDQRCQLSWFPVVPFCLNPLKPPHKVELSCTFSNGDANATIEPGCYHIEGLTDDPSVILTKHHSSYGDQCAHYVNAIVCPPNNVTGYAGCDCSSPDKCVNCAMRYHTEPSENYEFAYECTGRKSPLEEIRSVCNATVGRQPSPIVSTASGKVQGFKDVDSLHYVFRGIPFAAPPIGSRRFRPPQPVAKWDDVLNASEYGSTCIQRGPAWRSLGGVGRTNGSSEDCLYLNVFTPAKYLDNQREGVQTTLAPVLIYFPAGQFMWGSGNDAENFNAPQTPAGGEVVVITANYRLGAFGFLGLDELRSRDPAGSTGNYGSLDQRAVLQWIHDNIKSFGGDPDNVVLWGESAGAAAVTAHLSMPGSFPLYHKAILESGAFNGWSYRTLDDARANAQILSKNLGCLEADNVTVNITCLENVDAETMISLDDDGAGSASAEKDASGNVIKNLSMPFMDTIDKSLWSPVIDGVVLHGTPVSLLREGKVANVPIILGTNRDEGSTFTGNLSGTGDGLHTPSSFYDTWLYSTDQVDFYVNVLHTESSVYESELLQNQSQFEVWATDMFGKNASQILTDMYHPGTVNELGQPIKDWWWSVSQVVGDFVLTCPARRTVRSLEDIGRSGSSFLFFFDHTPNVSVNQAQTDLWGAFHGSEVPFVWYDVFELVPEDEQQLSAAMVQYWVNFAWNGNPNVPPPGQTNPPKLPSWDAYSTAKDNVIVFGDGKLSSSTTHSSGIVSSANVSIISGLKKKQCDFWDAFPTQWTDKQ